MKTKLSVLAGSAMLLGGTFLCQAMPGPGNPPPQGCGEPAHRDGFPAGLAHILELSEVQKGQIRVILDQEKEKGAAQHKREGELREKLQLAEHAAAFDEQAVRTAAVALAGLEAERIVARVRTHYRVSAVLTPAQRSLAERLRPERGGESGPPCGSDHERRPLHGPEDEHGWR